MISEDKLKEIVRELLAEHLEAQADWRSRIPSMVIIYPLDQNYLKSGFFGQKWMLKLCCMAPGEEHTLEGGEGITEGETHAELGRYRLDGLGEWTAPIIKWAKNHELILKRISNGLSLALGWVHQDAVTSFLKDTAGGVSALDIPDDPLPPGGGKYLPVSSELIRLAGLRESDYRVLEGQGLIFLQKVLEPQPCGNLHLFVHKGRMLWFCNRHLDKMKAEREAAETVRSEDLLSKYLNLVETRVRKVHILGDSEPHDLKEVFVELTTINERERPSSQTQAEYLGMLDSELRRLRNPLLDRGSGENQTLRLRGRRVKPEDLLQSNVRPLIVGAPGSGKSTLLRYLAYKTLEENEKLPVFLEVKTIGKRDFDAAEGKLTDLIFQITLAKSVCETESDRALMRKEFYQRLKAGRVSIFLDGLDEVSGKEFFEALRNSVKDFLQNSEYRQNNLYISTRPYALWDRFSQDEVQEMEIAPFNQEQIKQFVTYYYPGDQQADRFLTELQRHPELRELASVPALLGFLLLLYRKQGITPENRLELYHELVHYLVKVWDREKGAIRDFQTTDTRRESFLSYLAFARLFSESGQELSGNLIFTSDQILEDAGQYCRPRDIAQLADRLAEEVIATPLLRQVGSDTYAFAHLTIQEYLAAKTLAAHEDCVKFFCRAYFDAILVEMEVLPMTLGIAGQQKGLYDALEQLSESLDFKKLRLEGRSLKYDLLPDQLLAKLISILKGMVTADDIEVGYFDVVVKSFRGASRLAGESLISGVVVELENEAEIYREFAVEILGLLENEAATQFLHKAAEDTDHSVRIKAKLFLGLQGDSSAVDSLIKELSSEEADVKEKVIYALQQIGTEKAIDALKKTVNDDNYFVRKRSLETITWLCGEDAIPILIDHLDDPEDFVRHAVVTELGEIGGEKVIDSLIRATEDNDSFVAKQAFTSLGQIGGGKVYKYLIDYLTTHSGEHIGHAAEALGQIGNTDAIPSILPLLDKYKTDPVKEGKRGFLLGAWINDYVRVRVAATLCQLGDKRGQSILIEALESGVELDYVAKALSQTEGSTVKQLLITMLEKYEGEESSTAIAEALSSLEVENKSQIAAAMISVLSKNKGFAGESQRVRAINVLGQIGGQQAIEGLIASLDDTHPFVQLAAMAMIGNIALDNENTVPGLVSCLGLGFHVVNEEAARVIARMDNSTLYKGLILSLQNEIKYVRRKAAQSIVYYAPDEEVIEMLSALAASDPRERVRAVSHQALKQLEVKQRCYQV